jgi:hypothetical protein
VSRSSTQVPVSRQRTQLTTILPMAPAWRDRLRHVNHRGRTARTTVVAAADPRPVHAQARRERASTVRLLLARGAPVSASVLSLAERALTETSEWTPHLSREIVQTGVIAASPKRSPAVRRQRREAIARPRPRTHQSERIREREAADIVRTSRVAFPRPQWAELGGRRR